MAYEIEEVSQAVVKVFVEFVNKYPDRLRMNKATIEWKDESGEWAPIRSWDNFADYGDTRACPKCLAPMSEKTFYSDISDNPKESPGFECTNKACAHTIEVEEDEDNE